jgi:hypothetical protein
MDVSMAGPADSEFSLSGLMKDEVSWDELTAEIFAFSKKDPRPPGGAIVVYLPSLWTKSYCAVLW